MVLPSEVRMADKNIKEIISNPQPQFESGTRNSVQKPRKPEQKVLQAMINIISEGEEIRKDAEVNRETLQVR